MKHAVVRGYWKVADIDDQIEYHKCRSAGEAEHWRQKLNGRGCPIVTVTYER